MRTRFTIMLVFSLLLMTSCSYNPFIFNNHTTGSATGTAIGAGVGAGSVGLLGGSRYMIALGGIGGGAIGYYVTTLRYDSGGVIQSGGQVYKVGDFVGISIPSDKLFEPNTAELLPQAAPILDSAVAVLQRYPNSNILISGNTSGFSRPRWERRLSEERAKKIAAYFWNAGVSQFTFQSTDMRKLNYVGYGEYFPIANHDKNDDIRQNSRIQVTVYPTYCDLKLDQKHLAMRNMGGLDDDKISESMSRCLEENSKDEEAKKTDDGSENTGKSDEDENDGDSQASSQ